MEPIDLDNLRSLDELKSYRTQARARLQALDVEYANRAFPDDIRAEFVGLSQQTEELDDRIGELETRHGLIERQFRGGHFERSQDEPARRRGRYEAAVAERPEYARRALDVG